MSTSINSAPLDAAAEAEQAILRAIAAYELAGYGSHVTNPLRDALGSLQYSISEVRS
jgi:hypothetical protein